MSAASILLNPFLRNNKVLMISSIVAGLLNNVITLLLTLTIGQFFDDAFSYSTNKGRILSMLGVHLDKSLVHFFLFFTALIVSKLLLGWADSFLTAISGEKLAKELREQLFESQLHQDYEQFQQKETGKYLLRYSGDMRSVQNLLTKGMIGYTKDVLFVLTGIVFLLQLQAQLAAIFMLLTLSLILLTMVFDKKLKIITENKRDGQSSLLSFVTTRLLSLRSVKAFNKESVELDRFNKRSGINFKLARQYHLISGFIQASAPVVLYASLALLLGMTTFFRPPVHGRVLLSYVLLTILLFPSLRKIIKIRTIWQSGNLSAKKLEEIFNMPAENQGKERLKGPVHSISIRELNNEATESDEQQERTRMLFKGKLYFMNLKKGNLFMQYVMGIVTPPIGMIFINGTDIGHLSKKSIRKRIAVSTDSFPLYGRSIYEAVVYGKNAENREELLVLLHALQFSEEKEIDMDKPIGVYGNLLSTEQKKILLHARALLTGKQVLIFEEPFLGLSLLQTQALQSLLRQKSSKTIIIITGNEEISILKDTDLVIETPVLN
jgi:ABC-type multidrug transport system fused ATPase/permease subunit